VKSGCRLTVACNELGLTVRTVQRWRLQPDGGEDARKGPLTAPANKLDDTERAALIEAANRPTMRNLSPKKIVPHLADEGTYIASESTMYRVLRAAGQVRHRGRAKPPTRRRPDDLVARGPNRVWSWDITYLPSDVKGRFFYLYLFVDIWSRRIMKAVVRKGESAEDAAEIIREAACEARLDPARRNLILHADNGAAMKGATMLATLRTLGILPSFSRPSVSDDNPFSESLFRTLKYVPSYPRKPFATADAAWSWVERFVDWYNNDHLHSAIGFVTPEQRHTGLDVAILSQRSRVYAAARTTHPERWNGRPTRNWDAPADVVLNPRDPLARTRARASSRLHEGSQQRATEEGVPA
jgi:transposase InsO family protein